jgi:hypothetical protein
MTSAACQGYAPGQTGSQTPSQVAASASRGSSPGPTALAAQSFAVLVEFPNGTGPQSTGYELSLVAADGRIVAHTHAATRAFIHAAASVSAPAAPDLPEVSVANGRVYFLDGDEQVRYLTPGGSSGMVTKVPGSASAHAGFAISPDGTRIAVSVLSYQGNSASMNLYVEDVDGGNHHDLFQSSSEYAWPVAWHSGALVLALGPLFSQQGLWDNPYFASNFHVVDAATANRIATIGGPDYMSSCEVSGLLVPTGTACYHRTASSGMGGVFLLLGWDGTGLVSPAIGSENGGTAALNPEETQTAALLDASRPALVVFSAGNKIAIDLSGSVDSWPCWVDDQHVLIGSVSGYQPILVDMGSGRAQPVAAHGFCAAVLGARSQVR